MTREDILEKLKLIVKNYLLEEISIEGITGEEDLIQDLRINSAHLVDIIIDIEETFDIMIDDDAVSEMNTLNQAIEIISRKLSENN